MSVYVDLQAELTIVSTSQTSWLPYSADSYDLDLSVVFHDKYQWEIWENTAGKSATAKPNIWFSLFNMHLTYNTQGLREANVEVVIQNVEGDEKIDIIMTLTTKPY